MEEKYAVIRKVSHHIPGDERSRTHPGHGYPAHTVTETVIQTFESKEEWEAWIIREEGRSRREEYTPIVYREASVKTTITVDTDIQT